MKKLMLMLVVLMAAVAIALPGDVITIEAEDCILGGMAVHNGYGWVDVATDPITGDFTSEEGVGTMAFPNAIPDGHYILTAWWMVASWNPGHMGAYSITASGAGSVTLKDAAGVPTGVGWHSIYPPYNGHSPEPIVDQLVGPDSAATNTLSGSGIPVWEGSPVAAYMTLENIGAGELVFEAWDMSTSTYNRFRYDYFTLTEVIPEPATIGLLSLGALAFLRRRK